MTFNSVLNMFLDPQKPLQNTGLIDEYVAFPFASIFTKTDELVKSRHESNSTDVEIPLNLT